MIANSCLVLQPQGPSGRDTGRLHSNVMVMATALTATRAEIGEAVSAMVRPWRKRTHLWRNSRFDHYYLPSAHSFILKEKAHEF
ncbi:MAG: hypothetical protein JRI95_11835 [Deltaproteobacteria bacterium]|nr:hypothetical protein [Deltaproteobacteria bacterium]MBW2085453.1 hypothetical protein [Deltaproteobacteria bacterium]